MRIKHSLAVPTLLILAFNGCRNSEDNAAGEATVAAAATASATANGAPVTSVRAVAKGEAEASTAVGARAESLPAVTAAIGGQLVTVGQHTVELRLFKNATAEALVYDERGKLLGDQAPVHAVVHALAAGGARPLIALAFEVPLGRLSGAASGKADLVPGPIDIDLKLGAASATGRLEAPVLLVGPEMGGTLAVAGNYGIELLAHADGAVEALVHDAAGALVNGGAQLKLEVNLTGTDGRLHAVILAFDAASARFVGRAEAGVKLAAGAAQASVNGGVSARLPNLALVAAAQHGGKVLVAGDFSVELVPKGHLVSAFVYDASGAASARADLNLALRLGQGGFVKLAWDAPSASYRATLAANLDLQPITLALKADAKTFLGASLPNVKGSASIAANAKAGADVDAKAIAAAKLQAKSDFKAPAVSANAQIQAPKISVGVGTDTKAGAKTGAGAKAGASFSFGTK